MAHVHFTQKIFIYSYLVCDTLINRLLRNFINRKFLGVRSSSYRMCYYIDYKSLVIDIKYVDVFNNGTYVIFAGVSRDIIQRDNLWFLTLFSALRASIFNDLNNEEKRFVLQLLTFRLILLQYVK